MVADSQTAEAMRRCAAASRAVAEVAGGELREHYAAVAAGFERRVADRERTRNAR